MRNLVRGMVFCALFIAVSATAQVTGSGTTNTVPLFTAASTIGNSAITQGPVGNNGLIMINATNRVLFQVSSNYTVGTELEITNYSTGAKNWGWVADGSGGPVTNGCLALHEVTDGSYPLEFCPTFADFMQNVGIGTTTPGAALEVNGNIKLTSSSGGSITFQDGTTQSTAYTGVTCGGDYAESVDVTGSRTSYEPGDLLVIDPTAPGMFLKSAQPYSTLVAGIYSTKPGTVGRRETTYAKTGTIDVPMAMMGIVPTKVSAENGPIKVGDLLVTSSMLGHAMKGTDRNLLTGAVVGKALGSLDSGTGMIEVLVTLQ